MPAPLAALLALVAVVVLCYDLPELRVPVLAAGALLGVALLCWFSFDEGPKPPRSLTP